MNFPFEGCVDTLPMLQPFTAPMRGRKPIHGLPASLLRPGRGTGKFRVHNVTAREARIASDNAYKRNCQLDRDRKQKKLAA